MLADEEGLPQFAYHPDPVGTGSIVAAGVVCACCGRWRPFMYVGPVFAVEKPARALCPWCIADGRAAAMFDAQFTDASWRVPDDVPADVTEVVLRRTPGFVGWQQEQWLHHCRDAAEFHGSVGANELAAFPDALEHLRLELAGSGWSADDKDWYLQALRFGVGGPAGRASRMLAASAAVRGLGRLRSRTPSAVICRRPRSSRTVTRLPAKW